MAISDRVFSSYDQFFTLGSGDTDISNPFCWNADMTFMFLVRV